MRIDSGPIWCTSLIYLVLFGIKVYFVGTKPAELGLPQPKTTSKLLVRVKLKQPASIISMRDYILDGKSFKN